MDVIDLPETARNVDFAPFVDEGEIQARSGIDQNGDRYILTTTYFDDVRAKVGDVIVRFARVHREDGAEEFIGWRKQIVGKVVDVRYNTNRTIVRYDIDPIK